MDLSVGGRPVNRLIKPKAIWAVVSLVASLVLVSSGTEAIGSNFVSCTKLGQVKVVSGVRFICKPVRGQLVWTRQSIMPPSAPSSKPPTTPPSGAQSAFYGQSCSILGSVAKGRGADGSNLVCRVETAGTFRSKRIWAYAQFPTLKELDLYIPAGAGGGFDKFGRELMRAMKAEGTLVNEATFRNISGASGTTGLSAFLANEKGKSGKALVTGFAMVGGAVSNKLLLNTSDAVAAARMMGDWEVIVVPANSPYKTLADLVRDIKSKKTALPIAGGNLGGIDHYTAVMIYEALGLSIKDLNYGVYSGGAQIASGLLNAKVRAGISGYGEFKDFVDAGSLRILGITSPSKVPGINAETLKAQGVDVVAGNWRGLMLPEGVSMANRNLAIRALDVTRRGSSWQAVLTNQFWSDYWLPGQDFQSWLTQYEDTVKRIYKESGL